MVATGSYFVKLWAVYWSGTILTFKSCAWLCSVLSLQEVMALRFQVLSIYTHQ